LYLSLRRAIKHTEVIIGPITFANYVQNVIQHPALKVNSIYRENFWGSTMWISTQQSTTDHILCIRQILAKKMEIQRSSKSALYILQES
jgi:hypothetical protein